MNYKYFLLLLFVSVFACTNPSDNHSSDTDEVPPSETVAEELRDTSMKKNESEIPVIDVSAWTVDDYIIKKPEGFEDEEVNIVMTQMIEHWKNAANPLTLTYKGAEMHDYYYINFEDVNNNHYDFGYGKNDFGDYELIGKGDETNPKYLDKTFKVTWDWKKSFFPCCSGGGNIIDAYQPSIVSLELVE